MQSPDEISNPQKADILTLYLIGLTSLPEWVDPLTCEMAKQVFDANRGKFELESAAVLKVINERYKECL